jgi:predicted transcriptional regulator
LHVLERLDSLAENLSRPRSWVINQAIQRFIEYEEWFVREVKAGLQKVEQGKVATDKEVSEVFLKWGVDAR